MDPGRYLSVAGREGIMDIERHYWLVRMKIKVKENNETIKLIYHDGTKDRFTCSLGHSYDRSLIKPLIDKKFAGNNNVQFEFERTPKGKFRHYVLVIQDRSDL